MKLSVALIATALASKDERAAIREEKRIRQEKRKLFTPLRYVYQFPICDSVEQCVNEDNPRCDGEVFENESGSISHRAYGDKFNCRWEIIAQPGNHVGLKFYNDFDLEWQSQCGFDRVHIRCLDDPNFDEKGGKPISRLCGPKDRSKTYAFDALKIMPKNSFFKESTSTKCKHVLIEMNTDQDTGGISDHSGFTLGYYQSPDPNAEKDKNPCLGRGYHKVSECLSNAAIATSKAEYAAQIANEADLKKKARLVKNKELRLANAKRHIVNYMSKMNGAISRCGRGYSAGFTDAFYTQLQAAAASKSADQMFAIWNVFAAQTMTGDGASCSWLLNTTNEDSAIEESSFPCRTRRLFLKMKGKTQYGQYTECNANQFNIDDNVLFR